MKSTPRPGSPAAEDHPVGTSPPAAEAAPAPAGAPGGIRSAWLLVLGAALAGAVLLVHWPVLRAAALPFDDTQLLTDNPLVQRPGWTSARRVLTEVREPTAGASYRPLAFLSLMLDYRLGGRAGHLQPFHRTSLVLHVLNTLLVMLLLYQLFGQVWVAGLTALLFGAHPLSAETSAWVGQRGVLLATFFALACLLLYARASGGGRRWGAYVAALLAYTLAVMSGPRVVLLPLALLALDYWPLGRLSWRSAIGKAPFLAVAAASLATTLASHAHVAGAGPAGVGPGLLQVPLAIGHLAIFYLRKVAWPTHLSPLYLLPAPLTLSNPAIWVGLGGMTLLLAVVLISLRWTRALLAGVGMFLLLILPALAAIACGWGMASNHCVYLPAIGLLLILAAAVMRLSRLPAGGTPTALPTPEMVVVLLAIAGFEALATQRCLLPWRSTERLARSMVAEAPQSSEARLLLGTCLFSRGLRQEGLEQCRQAVRLEPDSYKAHGYLGDALLGTGQADEAIAAYRESVRLNPRYAPAHLFLGYSLAARGQDAEAVEHHREAVRLKPKDARAHLILAQTLIRVGQAEEGVRQLRTAKALDPQAVYTRMQLGRALLQHGSAEEGLREYEEAMRLAPDRPEVPTDLAEVLTMAGKAEAAMEQCRRAIRIRPDFAQAHADLAVLLLSGGQLEAALVEAAEAVRLDPRSADARNNRAVILVKCGRLAEAAEEFRQAVAMAPENLGLRVSLGSVLEGLGHQAEASEQYRAVLRVDPSHAAARSRLAAAESKPAP